MKTLSQWLRGMRRSHPVWLGLVGASALFLFPLLFAPLAAMGGGRSPAGDWRPVGLQGESVLALSAISREGRTVLYAQTHSGLWRKDGETGGAEPWERIDGALPHGMLGAPQVAAWRNVAGSARRMYALAGPADARQLYRSEDGGATWNPVGPAPGQSLAPALAVLPGETSNSDVIMIATATRLQRSVDGGATWNPGGPWPEHGNDAEQGGPATRDAVSALLVEESAPDRILAVSLSGELWVSENGGLSWHAGDLSDYLVLTAAFAAGRGEWAAATSQGKPALLFSPDNMASWDTRSLPEGPGSAMASGSQAVALAAEPGILDSLYAAVRGGKVYRTTDGGRTWQSLGGPRATSVTSLVLSESRATLYATTEDGVWARAVEPVTPTATPTATRTTAPTATLQPTATPTRPAATAVPTDTATFTPTATATPTLTATATATATSTATRPPAAPTRRPTARPPTPTSTATPVPQPEEPVVPPVVEPGGGPPPPTPQQPGPEPSPTARSPR